MKNVFRLVSGEPGVFIGKINPNNPTRAFLGYVNQKESQKKIVYDVLSKGDSAFISGNVFL
jgi:solute carrier family 27 fatty acid transporter 1/4